MDSNTRNTGNRLIGARWTDEELKKYYKYFHKYKRDCTKVAKAFNGSRSEPECEAVYSQFQSFLGIPYSIQLEVAFVAMVNDSYKTHEADSDTMSDEEGPRRRNGSTMSGGGSQRGRRTPRGGQFSKPPRPTGSLSNLGYEAMAKGKAATPISKPSSRAGTPATGRRGGRGGSSEHEEETVSEHPMSTRRKRSRKLFGAEEQQGEDYKSYLDDWRAGLSKDAADDVGEGVDALLSLASLAHATSNSCAKEEDEAAAAEQEHEGGAHDDEEAEAATARRAAKAASSKATTPGRKGRRGARRAPVAPKAQHDDDYNPGTEDGEAGDEGEAGKARVGSGGEDERGDDRDEKGSQGGRKRSASTDLPSPTTGLLPKRQASYAAMTGRYGVTSYEAMHNGTGSYGGMGYDTDDGPAPTRTGMGTRAVLARALQRSGNSISAANHNKRKSAPEKIPGGYNSPFKLLFSRGTAQQSTTSSYMPAGGIVPGMQMQQVPLKQVPVGETGDAMGPAEVQLRHCLGPRTRRWAMYEFQYSALDRPYFMRSELQELLHHAGLSHVSKLTRAEWGALRALLGKPRRMSLAFLREERVRLEHYRELTRKKYEEVGVGMEVPPEVPRPLKVGQAVVARHPVTRQLHDGIILTIKSNKYRVQFSRAELMTEMVRDIDVMPQDPTENLPAAMALVPAVLNGRVNPPSAGSGRRKGSAALRGLGRIKQEPGMHHPGYHPPLGVARPPPHVQQQPAAEPDAQLLADVGAHLDVKEALLAKLKKMNAAAEQGLHMDANQRNSDEFQRQYASIMVQLKEVNDKLQLALDKLHRRPHLSTGMPTSAAGVLTGGIMKVDATPRPVDLAARGAAVGVAQTAVLQAHDVVQKCVARKAQAGEAAAAVPMAVVGAAGMEAAVAAAQQGSVVLGMASELMLVKDEGAAAAISSLAGLDGAAAAGLDPTAAALAAAAAEVVAAVSSSSSSLAAADPMLQQALVGSAFASAAADSTQNVHTMVTGCMSVLLTLQKGGAGGLTPAVLDQALDMVMPLMRPRSAAGTAAYEKLTVRMSALRELLAKAVR